MIKQVCLVIIYVHNILVRQMSFRDAFTRSSTSSENLRYDDAAAYHFYITILIIVGLPLGWSILKTILNPFSNIPNLKEIQKKRLFRDKIAKFKKENRFRFVTFKFVLKVLLVVWISYALIKCIKTISQTDNEIKGFDPYQILEVENDAPIEKIKKAYRKLALLYHPDRNPDNPEASAKFIIISKAYQCLTDEEAKEKCLKYGNPDGAGSFNVGIALPEFLIKKENHVGIMGVVFLLVVIVLPIFLIHYHSQMNKYDDFGMLTSNLPFIHARINQHFNINDGVILVAGCYQFERMPSTSAQTAKLDLLLRQFDPDELKKLDKRSYQSFIKKILLLDARINEKQVAQELYEDLKVIMKKTPVIIKSSINGAYERSHQMHKGQQFFAGKNCIQSLIMFQQYFIQGKSHKKSQSFTQLDLSEEEIERVNKKKKNRKITSLQTLIEKQEERDFFLNLLDANRSSYIKECIEYFPKVDAECNLKVDEESEIAVEDIFQIIITVTTNRLGNFCSSPSYPFLKRQGWYLLLSQGKSNALIHMEYFQFDELTKIFKVPYRQEKKGNYSLNFRLMSDCYFGLDLVVSFKYTVGAKKIVKHEKDEKQEELQSESWIQRWTKTLLNQEEEEVSDSESEKDQKQKLQEKKEEKNEEKDEEGDK